MQIQSDSNEVLCGIILFIDQMFMADNDHQGSECPLFTLSILPRHIRNQAWAWHPLGFIPKFESHHLCGQNMQALHLVLARILSGLCGIQEIGGLTTVVLLHHCPNKLLLLSRSQLPSLLVMSKAMTNFVADTQFIITLSNCAMSVTVSLRMWMITMYVAFGLGLASEKCFASGSE